MKSRIVVLAQAFFVLIVMLSFGSVVGAQAQVTENYASNKVRFVGIDGNMFVFDLQLAGLPPKGNVVRITDDRQNVLFEERFNSKAYQRRYKIERGEMDKIYFEVINRQTLLRELFLLHHRVEEKWEVIKA